MSSPPDKPLKLEVTIKSSNPNLLEGLDVWLRLGLISEAQVKQLGRKSLTCLLPQPVAVPTERAIERNVWEFDATPEITPAQVSSTDGSNSQRQSIIQRLGESFKEELSVRWLLFLGVFLVVLSSGVLAATQWQNFPPVGQYGVLWAYTIIFWVGSIWAGKQQNLQLTAQTLRLVTFLLLPVNFWAMDSFGLWQQSGEWIVAIVAAFTLTAITITYQRRIHSLRFASGTFLLLLLSFLHWGWHQVGFPLIAVYIGMVVSAVLLPRLPPIPQQPELTSPQTPDDSVTTSNQDIAIGHPIVIYALGVLLARAIFVVQLPVVQLGLALGICGWLLARLGLVTTAALQSKIWQGLGVSLLLLGWGVSVGEEFPWQATVVSGLGLWFFTRRLQHFWQRQDLLAIFAIGLQTLLLLWRLVPVQGQQILVTSFAQLTNSQTTPYALLSLSLFPYVIGMVVLIDWLYRANKAELAQFAERLTFSLGLALSLIGLVNPTLQAINLVLSTATLATVTFRWTLPRIGLVYLTHITGLLAFTSIIHWQLPNLNQSNWAGILLGLMAIEWGVCRGNPLWLPLPRIPHSPLWQRSAWHLGFVLSGLSYALLFNDAYPNAIINTPIIKESVLLWLLTPLALTGIAHGTDELRRGWAARFSVVALEMAQFLTLWQPGVRLIGLSFAAGLMLVNTRYWRSLIAAMITIGFALGFVGALLWDGIPGLPQLRGDDWFLVGAIATIILWLLRHVLTSRSGTLAALYAQAADRWAVLLCSLELVLLTLHSIGAYFIAASPNWTYLITSILLSTALVYRCWQQPKNVTIYGISWGIELTLAQAVILADGSTLELATVNIILGLVTLFVSEWWLSNRHRVALSSVELVSLLYALLGVGLRWGHFTSWTGLLTLGAALTGIGVGRRRTTWKPLTYLSLSAISLAWYELVIYQMLQAQGGSRADALTILAGVAVGIAYAYRLLAWFWQSRTDVPLLNLSVAELKITAHLHWAIGSFLLGIAVMLAIPEASAPPLANVTIVLSLLLAAYALVQGRQNSHLSAATGWVYAGLVEVAATYVAVRLIWTELSVLDAWLAVITCGLAYGMYELPWPRWGWVHSPWQNCAIALPLLTVWATNKVILDVSLLAVAGFYGLIAYRRCNFRFTYISVLLIDWAIARWFDRLQLTDPLWYATLIGLSLLYIAQFDPSFQQRQQRQTRHRLRILGGGVICVVALLYHQETGLIPSIISIIAIFTGISLRVRAFLYVGTATLLLTAFYQLVILISTYSFVKWVVGLIAGIIFIGIAANFETRREQMLLVFRGSRRQLEAWD